MAAQPTRDLVRAVRAARKRLAERRRLRDAMSGHPEHPAWRPILDRKPADYEGSDKEWADSCWVWIVPEAEHELARVEARLIDHLLRTVK